MKFDDVQKLSKKQFRRVTGLKRKTFDKAVEVVRIAYDKKRATAKSNAGRPPTLGIEERVLMMLEYLREYRTYLSIGLSYGLSESNAFENIRWVENVLIQSKVFSIPGKKALLKGDRELILIDVTESPIERPKKNSVDFILERRNVTL
jgi:hypothetical protein